MKVVSSKIIFCLNENDSNLFIIIAVIHVFDLIPGASRQNEPSTCHTKTIVKQISVSRAGSIDDQYLVFVDRNRDLFCTSLKTDTSFEIYKIGLFPYTYILNTLNFHLPAFYFVLSSICLPNEIS